MLKIFILTLFVVLAAVNLVLLWQIYRKMKQNLDIKLETIEPYIIIRLTAFGINMIIIGIICLGRVLLQIFFHA